jgi:hypothetical protein
LIISLVFFGSIHLPILWSIYTSDSEHDFVLS